MKKIFTIFFILLSLQSYSQVDKAIELKVKELIGNVTPVNIDSQVNAGIKKFIEIIGFDTVIEKEFKVAGNLDTLTTYFNGSSIYEIKITGNASADIIVGVMNKAGVYSVRTMNLLAWSGATNTALTISVVGNKVIVKTTGATGSIKYRREKKTE